MPLGKMKGYRNLIKEASEALAKKGFKEEAKLLTHALESADIQLVHDRYMLASIEGIDSSTLKDWFHIMKGRVIREQVFKSSQKITEEDFRNWYKQWSGVPSRDTQQVVIEDTSDGGSLVCIREVESLENVKDEKANTEV